MVEVTVDEAKVQLSRLLQRVAEGEEVVIVWAGHPVARLVPYARPRRDEDADAEARLELPDDFEGPAEEDPLRGFER